MLFNINTSNFLSQISLLRSPHLYSLRFFSASVAMMSLCHSLLRNENATTTLCTLFNFVNWRLFFSLPARPKRWVIDKNGDERLTARFKLLSLTDKLIVTLKAFWSPDWKHPMKTIVSDWPWVQRQSNILVKRLTACFEFLLQTD